MEIIDKIIEKKWVAIIIFYWFMIPESLILCSVCSKITSSRPSAGTKKFIIGSICSSSLWLSLLTIKEQHGQCLLEINQR